MLVALGSTKIPILVQQGLWKIAHEARTDFSMILGATFLLLVGTGAWSIDERIDLAVSE
jgi:putative oxidoreductase